MIPTQRPIDDLLFQRLVERLGLRFFYYRHDPRGVFTYVSPSLTQVLGYSTEEFETHYSTWMTDHPVNRDVARFTELSLKGAEQPPYLVEVLHRDGTPRMLEVSEYPVKDEAGKVVAVEGVAQDVTERQHAYAELREREERLRSLSDNLADGMVYQIDSGVDGSSRRFTHISPAVERMHGLKVEEVLSDPMSLYSQVFEEDLSRVADIERAAFSRMQTMMAEVRVKIPDGGVRWRQFTSSPRRLENGHVVWDGIEIDIHERKLGEEERARLLESEKEARRAAENAIKVRDEFLSIAAHDLKTPLGALQIQVECMERAGAELNEETRRKGLDLIGRQTRRLIRLVNGLLVLSRIQSGRFELTRRPGDLDHLVRDVLARQAVEIERAGCRVEESLSGGAMGEWDSERLEQIIENLLSNALKFGAGKPIRIETAVDESEARLVIADRGIGIPSEEIERIFEPFERAHTSLHYGGMGMGLYIAQKIARAHDGEIRVRSAPDQGTVFTLSLPRSPLKGTAPPI